MNLLKLVFIYYIVKKKYLLININIFHFIIVIRLLLMFYKLKRNGKKYRTDFRNFKNLLYGSNTIISHHKLNFTHVELLFVLL